MNFELWLDFFPQSPCLSLLKNTTQSFKTWQVKPNTVLSKHPLRYCVPKSLPCPMYWVGSCASGHFARHCFTRTYNRRTDPLSAPCLPKPSHQIYQVNLLGIENHLYRLWGQSGKYKWHRKRIKWKEIYQLPSTTTTTYIGDEDKCTYILR